MVSMFVRACLLGIVLVGPGCCWCGPWHHHHCCYVDIPANGDGVVRQAPAGMAPGEGARR
jgi:hypothetical protein